MSKIRELESAIGAGARNNKYRVIFPYFGRELDIQTHDVTAPGRSMGIAEVYLKGRKYQLAGDRADEGSITLTFYNDPNMTIRRFFLQVIGGMQNFDLPITVDGGVPEIQNNLTNAVSHRALIAFDEIRNNFQAVGNLVEHLQTSSRNTRNSRKSEFYSHSGSGTYQNAPWYQTDIRIQQLDNDGEVASESVYHSAFVTEVSAIDYQDEVGEISTTTLTIAYTGVSYGDDSTQSMSLNRT